MRAQDRGSGETLFGRAPHRHPDVEPMGGLRCSRQILAASSIPAAAYLPIVAGWIYVARMYRPGRELLDGEWTSPEAEAV